MKLNLYLIHDGDYYMWEKEYLQKIREAKEKWEVDYKKSKERDVKFVTDSEIPIKKLYTPLDVKSDFLENVNFPGNPPYTRRVSINF